MYDSAKYLIHADIYANGVVERNDVVGAIFGQTEGLLGSELDLRDLQESSKLGRIDVDVESEGGRSFGSVTVASGLDRVETAVLAAALETIERVGPCRARIEVAEIEDARAAKRRDLVDRAADLLVDFEDERLTTDEIVDEVRRRARVADIDEYEGLPAGPRVADSDATIVVEGRADVRQLLEYGIKNAVAVEGTDVPDAVADLTTERTVTAFLDGDRGGDLILRELVQVGDVDYVAVAPAGRSVEDLSREDVMDALRGKVPVEEFDLEETEIDPSPGDAEVTADATADGERDGGGDTAGVGATASANGSQVDADGGVVEPVEDAGHGTEPDGPSVETQTPTAEAGEDGATAPTDSAGTGTTEEDEPAAELTPSPEETDERPATLPGHVDVLSGTGRARLLDADFGVLGECRAGEVFDAIADAETAPSTVVLDGDLSQRVLDVAAQRGVGQIVAADTGEFVKQPAGVRVRTAGEF